MDGQIELDGCKVELVPEHKYEKKFCFEIHTDDTQGPIALVAKTGTSMQEWMTSIRRSMLKIRRQRARKESVARRQKQAQDDNILYIN